jgi:hypothetical protein
MESNQAQGRMAASYEGASHTPGPWRAIFKAGMRATVIAPAEDYRICAIGGAAMGDDADEANARLIAAAPELLEALKESRDGLADALNNLPADGECAVLIGIRLAAVDAAIAKAEGR